MADINDKPVISSRSSKESIPPEGALNEEFITVRQTFKQQWRMILYCVALGSNIFMFGFDYVIIGTVSAMPGFQYAYGERFGDRMILPSMWLGLWNFSSPGAQMVGSLFAGFFQDKVGRRATLVFAALLCAGGVAILYCSDLFEHIDSRRGAFLGGKAVQGAAIGMAMTTTHTYMSEVLPTKLRGPILSFFPTFTNLGQLIGAGVILANIQKPLGYRLCFALQWPFAALPLAVAFILPESPVYFIRRDQIANARAAQLRLDPDQDRLDITITHYQQNIEHEQMQTNASYMDTLRGTNRRRTIIIIFSNLLPQAFGLTLLAKASYFLQVVGMQANTSVIILILGLAVGLVANFGAMFTMAKFGRRQLLLFPLGALAVAWASMGIAGIWRTSPVVPTLTMNYSYTAAVMIIVTIIDGCSVWPVAFTLAAETPALQLRSKSQGVGWFTTSASAAIFGFFLPYIFNPDQGNLGAMTGFFYAGLCMLALVAAFFVVPEMKDLTTAQIDDKFERQVSARSFSRETALPRT